jgi:hypothetical protein
MILEAFTIGLSLYTWHPANSNDIHELRLNNNTPGVYVRNDDFTVAVFENSWGKTSIMGALNYRAGPFDFMVGAATGYQYEKVSIPCSPALYQQHGMRVPEYLASYGCTGTMGTTNAVLRPFVAASYRVPFEVLGAAPRISFMGNALNVSVEYRFK